MPDGEAHVGPCQRVAAHGLNTVREFGGVALEELAPCRGGEEQLLHLHRGAVAARGGADLAAARIKQEGAGLRLRARQQRRFRHRGDGRQRLAAKAHGGHGLQVMQVGDFAGGMAAQGDGQLVLRDAAAVILHANEAHAARKQPHGNGRGARVQRVVHQLAHHRRGALDHFARGDLADQLVGQVADGAAGERGGRGGSREGGACIHPGNFRSCG